MSEYKRLEEVPYDFTRRRLSVLVSKNNNSLIITEGALSNILEICTLAEIEPEKTVEISEVMNKLSSNLRS